MTRLIVITGFLLAFGAGLMVGHLAFPKTQIVETRRNPRSWIDDQLGLTDEQKIQMEKIWAELAPRGREQPRLMSDIYVARDKAIEGLIHIEDQPAYDLILRECDRRIKGIENEWRAEFQAAVDRTKAILTPEQREKYEKILDQFDRGARRGDRGGKGDRNGHPRDGTPGSGKPDRSDRSPDSVK